MVISGKGVLFMISVANLSRCCFPQSGRDGTAESESKFNCYDIISQMHAYDASVPGNCSHRSLSLPALAPVFHLHFAPFL